MINVFFDNPGYEVWVDLEGQFRDGVCIGTGANLEAALDDAESELGRLIEQINYRRDPLLHSIRKANRESSNLQRLDTGLSRA